MEDYYIELITRHLSNETSPDEETLLRQWLDADPANRLEFEALEHIWKTSDTAVNETRFAEKAAWEKIDPLRSKPRSLPLWPKLLAAACGVLVLCLAGWWFYGRQRQAPLQQVLASDDNRQLSLPDGSRIWLRKGALLSYPTDNGLRQVQLHGDAFFQPVSNPSRPFRIETALATIEDIGTSFLVREDENMGEVLVITGKVRLTRKEDPSHPLIISAGQKATILKNKLSVSGLGTPNFMSWKTGLLEFRQTPLDQVALDISDHYRTKVSLTPALASEAGAIKVTAHFDHQPLDQVLEEIKLTTGLQIVREKDTLFFVRQ